MIISKIHTINVKECSRCMKFEYECTIAGAKDDKLVFKLYRPDIDICSMSYVTRRMIEEARNMDGLTLKHVLQEIVEYHLKVPYEDATVTFAPSVDNNVELYICHYSTNDRSVEVITNKIPVKLCTRGFTIDMNCVCVANKYRKIKY